MIEAHTHDCPYPIGPCNCTPKFKGKTVDVPQFEMVGTPCGVGGCKGVLVDHVALTGAREFFRRCYVCGRECDRVPAVEKLSWAKRVLDRVFNGEREN